MTIDQTTQIMTILQTEYPSSFSKMDARQMALKLELWQKEFREDPYELVFSAVRILMREPRQFAPSIGDVRTKMHDLCNPEEMTESEAWALVSKACANGIYGYQKEFDKLPPMVQAAVGRPEQIREWALMDADTVESVVASNFMRSFKVAVKREKEMAMIPESVRAMLNSFAGKMLPEGGAENGN